jgi:hypothetical protein
VDDSGRRKPCVPPKVGFMCRRVCTLIKARSVLQQDRQDRLWGEYKKNSVADAIKRAKHEAELFLNSLEGREWLETISYEEAEEVMEGRGMGKQKTWRTKVANRRKKKIIRRFDRQIRKIEKVRDKKAAEIEAELAQLRDRLKIADGGYVKTTLESQVLNLTMRLSCLDETVQMQRLQLQCQEQCDRVDDDLFDGGAEQAAARQSDASSDTSDSEVNEERELLRGNRGGEGSDGEEDHPHQVARLARAEARDRAAADIAAAALKARRFARGSDPDFTIVPAEQRSALEVIADAANEARNTVEKNAVPLPRFVKRALRKRLRLVRDVVDLRMRKIMMGAKGDVDEIQKEMKHELYHQYISYHSKADENYDLFMFSVVENDVTNRFVRSYLI